MVDRKASPSSEPTEPVSEFPEHAKLRKTRDGDWEISLFLDHLTERGLFLSRIDPDTGQMAWVGMRVVEKILLEYRGVDVAAHAAESRVLRERYAHIFAQYGIGPPPEPPAPPGPPEAVTPVHAEGSGQRERDRQAAATLLNLLKKK